MAKVISTVATDKSPAPITPSDEHRASAKARGSDLDVLISILHGALGDVSLIMREIVAAAPPDDRNIKTLQAKLELFRGEANLFAP